MNELLGQLGLHGWKPMLTALMLPPVPFLALAAWGGLRLRHRRAGGAVMLATALVLTWLSCTTGADTLLQRWTPPRPAPLSIERVATLKQGLGAPAAPRVAIVVLGGGRELLAPEYAASNLGPDSMERLRYGLWLARRTGAPVGFAGGVGWGAQGGDAEALIAARIAADEFGLPLRWVDAQSRDTRENAERILPMLRPAGIDHVLLVTHGWHMPRALRAFAAAGGPAMTIEAAPMGLSEDDSVGVLRWMPSNSGYRRVRHALREALGLFFGA